MDLGLELKSSIYEDATFCRGFVLSNNPLCITIDGWKQIDLTAEWNLQIHRKTKVYVLTQAKRILLLLGHAYNPFDQIINEDELLQKLNKYPDFPSMLQNINEWTGSFTLLYLEQSQAYLVGDCACMQAAFYGFVNDRLYIASHAQIIGDLCGLSKSDYVKGMMKYKFWKQYGLFLPGNLTQFNEVKRLVPNTYVVFKNNSASIVRFFPTEELASISCDAEYKETLTIVYSILHENLKLIAKKWEKPAISMTGGMDSKTTVACANGLYDKFRFYSYDSMAGDTIDAEAARKIADAIHVTHKLYYISRSDTDFENIEELRKRIEHNFGDIGKANANDIRKRAFFYNTEDFDVEVKSWVSEVGRANYYKKFGVKMMPKTLSPRAMTTMYKLFTYNRFQAIATDQIFEQYINDVQFNELLNYDPSDMYLWEFRYGSWGGMVISGEHQVSYEITIPYNNRLLLNELLRFPLADRISDKQYYELIKLGNPAIDQLGITITNWNETKNRMWLEKIYWYVNRALPF